MRRVRRTFLQRFVQDPVVILADVPPLALADVRGRAVARLPWSPVRRWPFGRSRLAVRRLRRQLHGLDARARAGLLSSSVTPPPILASPSAFSPSRADLRALADLPIFLSWIFVPCWMPISRCPRDRLLPEIRRPLSADGCHAIGLAPPSWFLTTSAASSVHGSRHVAAGTGCGFARFSHGSLVQALRSVGAGPGSPLALPPCEGLLLVDSRATSLRPAPLLPFVASTSLAAHRASLRPHLAMSWGRAVRSSSTDTPFCLDVTLQDRGLASSVRRLPSPRGLPLDTTRRASGTGSLPVTRLRLAGCLVVSRRSCIRSDRVLLGASRPRGPRLRPHLRRTSSPEM